MPIGENAVVDIGKKRSHIFREERESSSLRSSKLPRSISPLVPCFRKRIPAVAGVSRRPGKRPFLIWKKNASNAAPNIPLIIIYLFIHRRVAPSAPSTPPQTLTPSRSPGKVSNITKSKFTSRNFFRSFLFRKSSIAGLAILVLCENEVRALNDAGRRREGGGTNMCSIDRLFSKPLLKIHGKEGRKRKIPFRSNLFNSVLSKLHGSFFKKFTLAYFLYTAPLIGQGQNW